MIHHTDCGMQLFTDDIIRSLLANSLETAVIDEDGWRDVGESSGSAEGEFVDWLTFKDLAESIYVDVKWIRNHPLVPANIPIYNFIYDVETGQLIEVNKAIEAGKAIPTTTSVA